MRFPLFSQNLDQPHLTLILGMLYLNILFFPSVTFVTFFSYIILFLLAIPHNKLEVPQDQPPCLSSLLLYLCCRVHDVA